MKLTKLGACAALCAGLAMTSCGCGDKCEAGNDTTISQGASDSISQYYGLSVGSLINGELKYYAEHEDDSYDAREFVKGMQSVLGDKKDPAYIAGINAALRVSEDLRALEQLGVKIDRKELMAKLRSTILADSISEADKRDYSETYQRLIASAQIKAQTREEARRNLSPEAQQNSRTGKAFVEKKIKEDSNVNNVDGVGVRIESTGAGSIVKNGDRVLVNMHVSRPDGKLVMGQDSVMVIVNNQDMPEGMFTGITRLAKGGKAVLYVPGEKAFGVNGIPTYNVGPNEAMVFDIEVLDINPTPEQIQASMNAQVQAQGK